MKSHLDLHELHEKLGRLDVRHPALVQALKGYAQPNKKIHDMIRSKDLILLTRGFYLLSPKKLKQTYSPEQIANLLHGPSYVSLERALSFHGLIPERVEGVTSVTTKKAKVLGTSIGLFTYVHLTRKKYVLGVQQARTTEGTRFLIATPAKALMDYLSFRFKGSSFKNSGEIEHFLEEDLRFDRERFRELSREIRARADLRALLAGYQRSPNHLKMIRFLLGDLQ